MKRKFFLALLITIFFLSVGIGLAQENDTSLTLRLNRNFGYGGIGKIQGRFTLEIKEPGNLSLVEFFIDGELMGTVEEPPFKLPFHTDDYSPGRHVFSAVGHTTEGLVLESNEISKVLLSSEDAWAETQQMIVPLLIVVGAITLIGLGAPLLFKRKRIFQIGKYGPAGGAVCPGCELPYSRHLLSPNLLVGKLERCPHCGKWSIVPQSSAAKLEEAESRYQPENVKISVESPSEEKLKQLLEQSRFED